MNTETGIEAVTVKPTSPDPLDGEGRRSGAERREELERRRSSKGLFEVRARREGIVSDRRGRKNRRTDGNPRAWYAFWQKD